MEYVYSFNANIPGVDEGSPRDFAQLLKGQTLSHKQQEDYF